jgi:hypothetical protein
MTATRRSRPIAAETRSAQEKRGVLRLPAAAHRLLLLGLDSMRSWLASCAVALGLTACGMASAENAPVSTTTQNTGAGGDDGNVTGGPEEPVPPTPQPTGAATCTASACLREVTCRKSCDGPITAQGCCTCGAGEIDDVTCGEDAGALADAGHD